MRPIEPINRLIQIQSKLLQDNSVTDTKKSSNCKYFYTLKNKEVLGKEGYSFWWSFGLKHFVHRLF